MPVIKTTRNRVVADDPEPDDVMVEVGWCAPVGDGRYSKPIVMPLQPISEYAAVIEWAVSIADKMESPIYILPLNHRDILNTSRFDRYRNFLASLTDQDRSAVKQIIVDSCAGVMRDSDDSTARANAFKQLVQLGVVQSW